MGKRGKEGDAGGRITLLSMLVHMYLICKGGQ